MPRAREEESSRGSGRRRLRTRSTRAGKPAPPLSKLHRLPLLGQFDAAGLAVAHAAELVVEVDAFVPLAFGVVVADQGPADAALAGAGDAVLDAAVAPTHAGHGRRQADAAQAFVLGAEVLAVEVAEVGVLALLDQDRLG